MCLNDFLYKWNKLFAINPWDTINDVIINKTTMIINRRAPYKVKVSIT